MLPDIPTSDKPGRLSVFIGKGRIRTICPVEKRTKMKALIIPAARFFREDDGVTAIEYALIGSLIAVVIVGAVTLIGPILNTIFEKVVSGFHQ